MVSVQGLGLSRLSSFRGTDGELVVFEGGANLPISIRRVFIVTAAPGAVRGRHAHKELTQVLVCVHGQCTVICDDAAEKKTFVLDRPDVALTIPPGIWAEQWYAAEDSVLMVMCDLPFDENDYIRDYGEFLAFRARGQA